MPRTRLIISALSLTAALIAVVPSYATADWFINGTKLATTAALAPTAAVDAVTTLHSPGLALDATCSGGTEDQGVHKITATELQYINKLFLKCAVSEPVSCKLSSPTIAGEPGVGVITKSGGSEDRVTIKAASGKELASIDLEGASCPVAGEKPVTGSLTLRLPTGQTESVIQAIESLGSVENNSLEISHMKLYLEGGKSLLKLASGSKWSFH